MREPWHIPVSWRWTTLGEVTSVVGGGTPKTSREEYWNGDIPWITPADLSGYERKEMRHGDRYITAAGFRGSSARLLPAGTVLFSSRAPIGYVAVAATPMATNQGFKSFVPPSEIDSSFLYYYLRSAKGLALSAASGTTFKELSKRRASLLGFPLAPVPEQHRIVARVDSLFAKLDDGIAALKRAETNLERYRASVLKAAVEGRLTERWRGENPPDETGEELLRRILVERRKRWEEEQLAAFSAKGRKPPRNWKSKYREPVAPDTSDLPALPEGWCWATVDQIGRVGSGITKGGKKREATRRAVPYLRVANVQRGFLDLSVVKTILASEDEVRRYLLAPGDVLFNEGGDRDKLGRGWVWRGEIPGCLHQNHVFRVRLFRHGCSPELLSHYGNSMGREWFFRKATQSVNLASINQTALRSLPVPLAPLREQEEIVRRLAAALGAVERARTAIGGHLERAATLRQSILKRAFEGRLVPQDPDDEPAAVLLERIRAAREA